MPSTLRRLTAALAAAALACAIALALLSAPAHAAAAQSATGDVTSSPFHIAFSAQRPANAPPTAATGTFDAQMKLGSITGFTLHGPVTCLDVRGNRVGLFYPIAQASPSVFAMLGTGVLVSLTVDGSGHAKMVSFLPLPTKLVSSCAPLPALLPAKGTATATS